MNAAKPSEAAGTDGGYSGYSTEAGAAADSSTLTGTPSDMATSPRITRPRSASTASTGFSIPPPLIAGSAVSSRGSTRIRRSILGTMVAAVKRRNASPAGAGPSLAWASVPVPWSQDSLAYAAAMSGRDPGEERHSSLAQGSDAAGKSEVEQDEALSFKDVLSLVQGRDGVIRIEILLACVAAVAAGGWVGGLYGVIAAAFMCILMILIAFVPLADI